MSPKITDTIRDKSQVKLPKTLVDLYGFKPKTKIQIELRKEGIFIKNIQENSNSIRGVQQKGSQIIKEANLNLTDLLGGSIKDWDLTNEA